MCGILAWRGDTAPDPELYADLERYAGRRGPDGHGWWTPHEGSGRALGQLKNLPRDPQAGILGHSRLATLGDSGFAGVQPVIMGGTALVHNGNIYNWKDLAPDAATDSFALGAVYAQFRDNGERPEIALEHALALSHYEATALILWDEDGTLLAYRRRLPLWLLHHHTGVYLSSGPLPGSVLVPEDTVCAPAPERSGHIASS